MTINWNIYESPMWEITIYDPMGWILFIVIIIGMKVIYEMGKNRAYFEYRKSIYKMRNRKEKPKDD
jgi:hypothetical protein